MFKRLQKLETNPVSRVNFLRALHAWCDIWDYTLQQSHVDGHEGRLFSMYRLKVNTSLSGSAVKLKLHTNPGSYFI